MSPPEVLLWRGLRNNALGGQAGWLLGFAVVGTSSLIEEGDADE